MADTLQDSINETNESTQVVSKKVSELSTYSGDANDAYLLISIPNIGSYKMSVSDFTSTFGGISQSILTTTLSKYVKSADLTTKLNGYVKSATLSTKLADYALTSDVATTLSDYVKKTDLTTTLDSFVKSTALNNILGDYAKSSDLTDYVKASDLDKKLKGYVKTSDLGSLDGYVTTESLTTTLGDYAKSADVNTNIETLTKSVNALSERMNALFGSDESVSDAIDTYNEILSFLEGFKDNQKLKTFTDSQLYYEQVTE